MYLFHQILAGLDVGHCAIRLFFTDFRKGFDLVMRESNRNLDIPPPGIPGEFACLVFEEGGNLTFFLVEGGEFAYGVGNLNFSFKHMC